MAELTLESCGLPSWEELVGVYSRFRREAAPVASRWAYSVGSAGLERPEPFWLERAGSTHAPLVDGGPEERRGVLRYGFTAWDVVPVWSRVHGDLGDVEEEWLRWMTNRTDLRLRFSLAEGEPDLVEVVVQRSSLEERLEEVIAFTDEGRLIHRETYEYDPDERIIQIRSIDGTPTEITAKSLIDVTYAPDGPGFAVRHLTAGEDFPSPPEGTAKSELVAPLAPAAVTDAAARIIASLSTAIATWCERMPRSGDITRIMVLHDWPVNPPFPPALVARSGAWSPGQDPYEFFEPDPELEAWFDTGPSEFLTAPVKADSAVLNAWFLDGEVQPEPLDLLVEIAAAARREIQRRSGRDIWVLPIDHSLTTDVARAVVALLPHEAASPIVEALRAGGA